MLGHYTRDGLGYPVLEPNPKKWSAWFDNDDRIVKVTEVTSEVEVSTVFLGIDHSYGFMCGFPVLWETMIFGGPHDQEQWRYKSLAEAIRGHEHAVDLASGNG